VGEEVGMDDMKGWGDMYQALTEIGKYALSQNSARNGCDPVLSCIYVTTNNVLAKVKDLNTKDTADEP
jgi:hypothetical protein